LSALDSLFALYYPAAVPKSVLYGASRPFKLSTRLAPLTDSGYNSGYTSENEDDEDSTLEPGAVEKQLALLRADEFERAFATRWLKAFITRAEDELTCFSSDEARQSIVEKAADLLTALLNPQQDEPEPGKNFDDDDKFSREFTFEVSAQSSSSSIDPRPISIRLTDGLAGARSTDHTDVGLQTWGASIVLCRMMCDCPSTLGLTPASLGPSPRIVELGAGTGLVSLVLGRLLPRLGIRSAAVVATDYHPSVISNLRDNIAANSSSASGDSACSPPVLACALDWAKPALDPSWPLGAAPADMLIATDVIYEPEHATMLYDCASRLLAPDGVFWLLATVRQNGRFGSVADTVEEQFGREGRFRSTGRSLTILGAERLEKQSGVGRGDETFYKLFRIGWE
jgi:predicted nicotinamide N-methyase